MTNEDLQQIGAIIVASIAASEERMTARIAASIAASEERIIHATMANLSGLRQELTSRFDSVERRLERVETSLHILTLQNAAMSKSLTDAERLDTATAATLSAQQRAIDQLNARIRALEARATGNPPPS